MTLKRMVLEIGMGTDIRGGDDTKAAKAPKAPRKSKKAAPDAEEPAAAPKRRKAKAAA